MRMDVCEKKESKSKAPAGAGAFALELSAGGRCQGPMRGMSDRLCQYRQIAVAEAE